MTLEDRLKDCPKENDWKKLHTQSIDKANKEGLFLEFGVYKGYSIEWLSKHTDNIFYGFDVFTGLPEDWRPKFPAGTFKCDIPYHLENEGKIKLIPGLFEDTLPNFIEEHKENVSFMHVDCDLYSATKTIFKYLNKQIVSGTVILFDELVGYPEYLEHEYKAFHEFLEETKYDYELIVQGKEKVSLIIK